MCKYKVGDIVVATNPGRYGPEIVGKVGVIKRVVKHSDYEYGIHGTFEDGTSMHLYDRWVEFVDIYIIPRSIRHFHEQV